MARIQGTSQSTRPRPRGLGARPPEGEEGVQLTERGHNRPLIISVESGPVSVCSGGT